MDIHRPEYVCCIAHTIEGATGEMWCGREGSGAEWYFQSIDHAVYAVVIGGNLQPCPECVAAIVKALRKE